MILGNYMRVSVTAFFPNKSRIQLEGRLPVADLDLAKLIGVEWLRSVFDE